MARECGCEQDAAHEHGVDDPKGHGRSPHGVRPPASRACPQEEQRGDRGGDPREGERNLRRREVRRHHHGHHRERSADDGSGATLTVELLDGVATGAGSDHERGRCEHGADAIDGPPFRARAAGADRQHHQRQGEHRKGGELEGAPPKEGHEGANEEEGHGDEGSCGHALTIYELYFVCQDTRTNFTDIYLTSSYSH